MNYIFLISGPIAVGKSAFTEAVGKRFAAERLSTRQLLIAHGTRDDRQALIDAGEKLDRESDGKWVVELAKPSINGDPHRIWVVDAVRTLQQIAHFREAYAQRIVHVHLTAPLEILAKRYAERPAEIREFDTYAEAKENGTERNIEQLAAVADFLVPTDRCEPVSELARATAGLGLFPREVEKLVDVVVGGQYGSEGKGNICAHLAQEYQVLVRVGGPNAGHKVFHPEYKYIQMPSGTLSNTDAQVLIGAGATLSVEQVLKEIADLSLSPHRLSIDPNAMIIEASDREGEKKNGDKIGSTKQGVGLATARKIAGRFDEVLGAPVRLAKDIEELRPYVRCVQTQLENAYAKRHRVLLEGTQGTDLSLHHGPYPHVTSRETTASGCLSDAGIAPLRVRKVVMVTRSYPIRVGGTSGELPCEISYEEIAKRSGMTEAEIRQTEVGSVSNKPRRMAEFDWNQLRRAAMINGTTDVALTFADYIDIENRSAFRFEQLSGKTKDFISEVERVANAPVSLVSKAFDKRCIIDRRIWR